MTSSENGQLGTLTAFFYQPAARFARGRLVLRLLCRFRVCISVRPHLLRAQ